ncbi:MAG: type II secretion system minor pseudopilin GspK [Gammaproteobacteria bacterium]|nr:type II secretion system minor pseudopilin GspK [Gammaproteobacteria bacterium]
MKISSHHSTQRGVALITALLVIALVTAAAVAMATRQQLDIRRTANTLQRDQAYVYAEGAEIMARAVLAKDDATNDHKEEDWAKSGVTIPFQGGLLTGTLEDLQGRFNVNNVLKNGTVYTPDVQRLARLLAILKGKSQKTQDDDVWKNAEPGDLANAVADWIDGDSIVTPPGGAEDSDYLQLERPYRAGNAPMSATSELLLVRGFTPAIYREVAPYVTALPEHTLINVNTARFDVLRALDKTDTCVDVSKLGREDVSSPVGATTDSTKAKPVPFTSLNDFVMATTCAFDDFKKLNQPPAVAGAPPVQSQLEDFDAVLSINTNFFQVNAYAEVGPEDHRVRVKLYSVLQRKTGKIAAISRAQGFE